MLVGDDLDLLQIELEPEVGAGQLPDGLLGRGTGAELLEQERLGDLASLERGALAAAEHPVRPHPTPELDVAGERGANVATLDRAVVAQCRRRLGPLDGEISVRGARDEREK